MNNEVEELLERLRATIDGARSMPMSSSAVIHRAEVLAQIDEIKASLPAAFADSDRVVIERERLLLEAKEQADRIIVEAQNEHERLVSDSEVYRVAKHEADTARDQVITECDDLRRQTDEYVDGRLANLEITLRKTLEAVMRGRDKLQGRSELERLDEIHADEEQAPFPFAAGRHSGRSI